MMYTIRQGDQIWLITGVCSPFHFATFFARFASSLRPGVKYPAIDSDLEIEVDPNSTSIVLDSENGCKEVLKNV
jgi:hypothetical protein